MATETQPQTDPEVPASAPAEEPADGTEQDLAEGETEQHEGGEGEGEQVQPADYEEIDFGGTRYSVPKALKDAFLMQSDYTRKTQTVAEQAKALEAFKGQLDQQAEALKSESDDRVQLHVLGQQLPDLDKRLEEYAKVDWRKFQEDNFIDYQTHWNYYQELKHARVAVMERRREITEKVAKGEAERSQKADAEWRNRIDETQRIVSREIKGWGPELATKLTEFGLSLGFTQQDLFSLNTDARQVKALHLAYLGSQLLQKQKQATAPGGAALKPNVTQIKPLATVSQTRSRAGGSASPSDLDDDETWLKKRTAQIRKRQA